MRCIASVVVHQVQNLPAMLETWVQSLGLEDPLETGKVNTPVFWPGEFHGLYSPWGLKESNTIEQLSLVSCLEQKSQYMWDYSTSTTTK